MGIRTVRLDSRRRTLILAIGLLLAAILVAVQDGTTQEFTTAGREFEDYKAGWWERVKRAEAAAADPALPSR